MKKRIVWGIFIILVLAAALVSLSAYRNKKEAEAPEGWPRTASGGVSFYYPQNLGYQYVSQVDWPPQAQVLDEKFSCTEAGEENSRAGKTEQKRIGGTAYCVTRVTEGVAGSNYTQYAYAFSKNNKTVILTFSLRFVRCENYSEPAQSECFRERNSFNIDDVIDKIAKTAVLSS